MDGGNSNFFQFLMTRVRRRARPSLPPEIPASAFPTPAARPQLRGGSALRGVGLPQLPGRSGPRRAGMPQLRGRSGLRGAGMPQLRGSSALRGARMPQLRGRSGLPAGSTFFRPACRGAGRGADWWVNGEMHRALINRLEEHTMAKLRVHNFTISLDGYAAGPDQGLDNPLGVGGEELHEWVFPTRTGRADVRRGGGERRASTTTSSPRAIETSARRSWAATCSARSAASGRTRTGRAGGATTRRTTTRCSCSPTTPRPDRDGGRHHVPLRHRRHRVGARPGDRGGRRRRTSGSAAAPRPSSSTCAPGSSTSCTWRSCRSCSAAASGSSAAVVTDGYEVTQLSRSKEATHVRLSRSRP